MCYRAQARRVGEKGVVLRIGDLGLQTRPVSVPFSFFRDGISRKSRAERVVPQYSVSAASTGFWTLDDISLKPFLLAFEFPSGLGLTESPPCCNFAGSFWKE